MMPSINKQRLIMHSTNLGIKQNQKHDQLQSATKVTLRKCISIIFELLYAESGNVKSTAADLCRNQTFFQLLAGITKVEIYSLQKIIIDVQFIKLVTHKNHGQDSYPDFPIKFICETIENNTGKIGVYDCSDLPLNVNASWNFNHNHIDENMINQIEELSVACKFILLAENLPLINYKNISDSVSRFKQWFDVFKDIPDIYESDIKLTIDGLLSYLRKTCRYPSYDPKITSLMNQILKENMDARLSKYMPTEINQLINSTENSSTTTTKKKSTLYP
ncbi:hypothetical protein [Escherichia coli]|uniref:hypothetical protein n=1 Tax=Escherichia coli TaxID=562 RepID=UPI0013664F9C|nr:hypothetical protein [Escherichia coli]MWT70260.1 hypothetical protein [Escherichia coli]